jgi:hypothetical protein
MRYPVITLSPHARSIVDAAVRDHCAHRKWQLIRANIRAQHAHVIVDCRIPGLEVPDPDLVLEQFKY